MRPRSFEWPPPRGGRHDSGGRCARMPSFCRSITLLSLLAPVAPAGLSAQDTGVVIGIVIDARTGVPVPDVAVALDGLQLLASTDSTGRFRLDPVPAGSRMLSFRHLAYGEHSRTVVVEEGGASLELEVRISQEAIELAPLVVDVMSEAERRRLASGSPVRELGFEEIQEAQRQGLLLSDLLRRVPGIRFRQLAGRLDCIEYRAYGTGSTCREMTVVMDGVIMGLASTLLQTVDLDEIQRLEVLSAAEAGIRYGIYSGFGVLLIETRTGPSPAELDQAGAMSVFDWDVEPEPYRWWRVFATSFVSNSAAVALTALPLAYCSHVLDGSLSRRERCHPWMATAAGVAAVATPGATAGVLGAWAGATPLSSGNRGWAMSLATLTNWAGAVLYFAASSSDSRAGQIVGLSIITLGTPIVVTVSDRYFRRLR